VKQARFTSWKELCRGTNRTYPTEDNIFSSANYGKRPPRFQMSPNGMRLQECRICQELERISRNKNVYEGHYGNYPTHCLSWSEMELVNKEKISRAVGYCPQCMGSKVFIKSKHIATECVVNHNRKHMYTCLNKDCLLQSWICKTHMEENQPLYDAHMSEVNSKQQNLKFCFITRL
jgi:hypothetical protein